MLDVLPKLAADVPFAALGNWPTPVQRLEARATRGTEVFVKRDDLSASAYGGNKVRTLEVLMGAALRDGCEQVVATGAYGSNHAVATVVHARALGLRSGAILCPQPSSATALENLEVTLSQADELCMVRHWSMLPVALWRWRRRTATRCMVMPPGGASPLGALGYVSAAFELAHQISAGQCSSPRRIVVPVGSTCTSAGLLVGLMLARRLGLAFEEGVPRVTAVRVTPWPVTSPIRIVHLAQRTSELLARLSGDVRLSLSRRELRAALRVDGRFIGAGYGRPTTAGRAAMRALGPFGEGLDTTYSAKAAACLLELVRSTSEPVLFWATKSTALLPAVVEGRVQSAPRRVRDWVHQCRALGPGSG